MESSMNGTTLDRQAKSKEKDKTTRIDLTKITGASVLPLGSVVPSSVASVNIGNPV